MGVRVKQGPTWRKGQTMACMGSPPSRSSWHAWTPQPLDRLRKKVVSMTLNRTQTVTQTLTQTLTPLSLTLRV